MTKAFQIKTNSAFNFDFTANRVSYRMRVIYNSFSNSYSFDIIQLSDMKLLLAGITLSTGTNLLSQFGWFRLWVIPTKPELYGANPTAETIMDFQIWVEDEQ